MKVLRCEKCDAETNHSRYGTEHYICIKCNGEPYLKVEPELPVKPPRGLTPRWIRIEQRMEEIVEAIARFEAHPKEVPQEWREELERLREDHPKALDEFRKRNKQ